MTKLLILESPGKIKKVKEILGSGWIVKASLGHIRELAETGVDGLGFTTEGGKVVCDYKPRSTDHKNLITELRKLAKSADQVFLATDEDREGESISWHLAEELGLKRPMRVVYSEITDAAVKRAIASPRPLDMNLVGAALARACSDKEHGFVGSKYVAWNIPNVQAKSVGRVQSAALYLLCEREAAIRNFVPVDYWSAVVEYGEGFRASYFQPKNAAAAAAATEADGLIDDAGTEPEEGATPAGDRLRTQAEADRILAIARSVPHKVLSVEGRKASQSPPPALTTSSLQQAASSKLKFNPKRTMELAQKLYEQGFITYMRTDSVHLSDDFIQAAHAYLRSTHPECVPSKVSKHHSKAGAQEAHEAIRPTHPEWTPDSVSLEPAQAALYGLIWQRSIAAVSAPAQLQKTQIITQAGETHWKANGQVVLEPGYLTFWNNLGGDSHLPAVQQNQPLTLKLVKADKKQTQPPGRYTEARFVQIMEKRGIGRPSTYATTIATLKDRGYAEIQKMGKTELFVPTENGIALNQALKELAPELVSPDLTARMESALDAIAKGDMSWEEYLVKWEQAFFLPVVKKAVSKLGLNWEDLRAGAKGSSQHPTVDMPCPQCQKALYKIPSRSKKLQADHFLSCDERLGGCGAVLFWSEQNKVYQQPQARSAEPPDPSRLTEFPCPKCGSPLERIQYQKEGVQKERLQCSDPGNRSGKCKNIAYFLTSKGTFWSKELGEAGTSGSSQPSSTPRTVTRKSTNSSTKPSKSGSKSLARKR